MYLYGLEISNTVELVHDLVCYSYNLIHMLNIKDCRIDFVILFVNGGMCNNM